MLVWGTVAHADCTSIGANLDEHLLVDPPRDKDYAGGIAIYAARGSNGCGKHRAPAWEERFQSRLWGTIDLGAGRIRSTTVGGGLLVLTPGALADRQLVPGDRPYASLLYLSDSMRSVADDAQSAVEATATFGLLGLGLAQSLQDALHHVTGSVQARGWSHQVSSGGEPTVRIGLSRQALWTESSRHGTPRSDLKWTWLANAGTVTDLGLAVNGRIGRIASPWWSADPEQNTYADDFESAIVSSAQGHPELFLMAGARVRVRVYDAFLEGQFRHSDLRYSASDLHPLLLDAWLGAQWTLPNGLVVRYLARFQTPELRHGLGARNLIWGSLEIARALCN